MKNYSIIWSDLDSTFSLNKFGDLNIKTNLECLEQRILNRLLTSKGERVMRPTFGSKLEKLLFEPISGETARKIAHEILMCLREESLISISGIDIVPYYSEKYYLVNILGTVKDLNLNFDFTKVLVHQL